jgi:hypothetical protein
LLVDCWQTSFFHDGWIPGELLAVEAAGLKAAATVRGRSGHLQVGVSRTSMAESTVRRAVPHEDLLRSGSRTREIPEDCGKGRRALDSARCTTPLNPGFRCAEEFDHKTFSARGACQFFVCIRIRSFV